ncbi:MAG TPA: hypothetical protein VF668_02100 [Pyrinomonadaceae bacterium]|jgi:hypothetical protein
MRSRTLVFLLCALCVAAAAPSATNSPAAVAAAAAQGGRQYVQGTMVGIGGRWSGRSLPFNLIVNNYTSPDDVDRLNQALRSGGQDELLRSLSRLNAGRISIGNNVGVTANAVISTPAAEGGTKLTVIYERNVNIYELRAGARSADYRFGYAEIFLDGRGRGEGTLIPAAKVRLEGSNTWVVEDFGVFPARLMGLRARGAAGGVAR